MPQRTATEELSEERRQEIFRALVEAQDRHEFTVPQTRKLIAERFDIGEAHLRMIEREGLDSQWPPL